MDGPHSALAFRFVCPLAAGMHARPATALAEVAARFISQSSLKNLRNNHVADARSVLSVIAADVRSGDECEIGVAGSDGEAAAAALRRFVEHDLPHCDDVAEAEPAPARVRLPRALQSANLHYLRGECASPGIGRGNVVRAGGMKLPVGLASETAKYPAHEQERIRGAQAAVRGRLEKRIGATTSTTQTILRAHLALVNDPSLTARMAELAAQGRSGGQAVVEACTAFMDVLRQSESAYLRARALDLQDICQELLAQLYGGGLVSAPTVLTGDSVVVAESLTPQQLLALDRGRLRGLILQTAGVTSHTAILARSLGIPAIAGATGVETQLAEGQEVLIDASRGLIVSQFTPAVERFYQKESLALGSRRASLARFAAAPGATADGSKLDVAANVSAEAELEATFASGADGIGVFRTEMLFAGRPALPSEEEQAQVYAHAVRAAAGRPVIIRTLDIGGDKPLPYLNLPAEANPFLGERGVRLYAKHREMIRTQVRAILRAATAGRIQIMVPMVSRVEEVRWMKDEVAEARSELATAGVTVPPSVPLGIMLEVPSACMMIEELAREVDFFSVGTNDLAQYFFAADRDNPAVSGLASPRHPAFLRFLQQTVMAAKRAQKWIAVCGDMAADVAHLPLMVGLGLDEISVPPPQVPVLKERLSRLQSSKCAELLQKAMALSSVSEVDALLASAFAADDAMLDPAFVILDGDCETKDEAIREIVNAFAAGGRTRDADALEDALWAREDVYSTGLGHGFAIPHCKSDAIDTASIGVLRLRQPLEWGSLDNAPVHTVVLLAMRESDAAQRHMQVFARLARKMMSEEFRGELASAATAASVVDLLRLHLETH